ncbi:copper homeostasis membrane protein CopD [Pseudomonas sp. NA-150]|uniref:copper homeostasis membrane protein CopD n=1 Tax=Pseudomonas sp. NA-150 TaxID=3367525 RepID=UPI0037CBE225
MQSALILCRFIHFAAVLLLFGTCLFRTWLFRPLLNSEDLRTLDQKLTWLTRLLIPVALFSALAWLVLTTGSMADSWQDGLDPPTLLMVLGSTFFGQVWSTHLLFSGLLMLGLWLPGLSSPWRRLTLAALLLGSLAPVGHGAMFDGLLGDLMMLNQLVHLCGIGAWLGGLLMLVLLLMPPASGNTERILLRFSGIGYLLVATIIITGLINVRVLSGSIWPVPALSGFGLILLIKVCLVLCMLGLALFNRIMLNRNAGRLHLLRTSVTLECLFGMAAVAAVSLLGTLPPMALA